MPLFDVSFTNAPAGSLLEGRIEVAPGIIVASLDRPESERIRDAMAGREVWAAFRLEIHTSTLAGRRLTDAQADTVIGRTLALLSCAVRIAPGGRRSWTATTAAAGSDRARSTFPAAALPGTAMWPLERVRTWGDLLRHWPLLGLEPPADVAFELWREPVAQRQVRPAKSFLTDMAALEALVGEAGAAQDRDLQLRRACTLVVGGDHTTALLEALRGWTTVRANYLHRGLAPTPQSLVGLHRFLMRALPATVALLEAVGGDHNHALGWLDAARDRSLQHHPLTVGDQWWTYVGLESILEAV